MWLLAAACLSRLAIVTGGTRGIGFGVAQSLAKSGHNLLLTFNTNETAALKAKRRLEAEFHVTVKCQGGDLCLPQNRRRVFEVADGMEDRLCAMVYNSGQFLGVTSTNHNNLHAVSASFGDGQDNAEKWEAMRYYQSLYGEAFVDMCEKSLSRMREGSIVGISSPGCAPHYNPNLGYDLEGSGKAIMEYAVRLIALRCASKGINANVVVPGVTWTDAWRRLAKARHMDSHQLVTQLADRIAPMGPMQARDVGDCVSLLCERRCRWITGLSIPVDGGVHLKI